MSEDVFGDERWFYMSFADPKLPTGTQFLGACYVQAAVLPLAITKTHQLGINPGGEIKIAEVPAEVLEANVPEADRHRLLTRSELGDADSWE